MTDDELNQRLRQSRLSIEFPAEFQREIWGRIEAAECATTPHTAAALWGRLLAWIARPVPAVAMALAMGGTGCLLAVVVGHRSQRHVAELVYLKSVSPFAAAELSVSR
ncbi:MAG: hypothetical protein ACKV19_25200 [Verrucomicrobiales bacterium]